MAEPNPGQGTAPAATPPRDIPSAVEAVKRMMQPAGPSETAPKATPEAKRKPDQEGEQPTEDREETKTASEAESEQPEPTEDDNELPETLDEIAEALGVKTDALMKALKVSTKDGSKATVADLLEGQLRDADYRKKTMELAEHRRQVEAQANQYLETLRQRAESVSALETMMAHELQITNTNLEKMLQDEYTDPLAYERAKAERDKRLQLLNNLVYQRHAAQQQATQAQAEQARQARDREQELLLKAMPDLKDPKKQEAFQRQLSSYLGDLGFNKQEVASYFSGNWDHRHIQILHEAAKYRVLKADSKTTVKKLLEEKPKVAKPGAGTQTTAEAKQQSTQGLREKLRHVKHKGRRAGIEAGVALVRAQLGERR